MLPSSKAYAGQEDFHGPCICKCNLKEMIPCSFAKYGISPTCSSVPRIGVRKKSIAAAARRLIVERHGSVNDGMSAGPLTFSAPPVIARLTSCMPQVVTPAAAAALVSE